MLTPATGTNGITSVAPMRGCSPWCSRRSMRRAATPAMRTAASTSSSPPATAPPTSVTTERLWLASLVRSSTVTPSTDAPAATISSTTSDRRPSEKLGTHSMSIAVNARSSNGGLELAAAGNRGRALRHAHRL